MEGFWREREEREGGGGEIIKVTCGSPRIEIISLNDVVFQVSGHTLKVFMAGM